MLQRYFIVLTNTQEEPYEIDQTLSNKVLILKDVHPTPDTIKEVIKEYPMYSFAFLFKGTFSELTLSSFTIAKKQLIRKYNCSSFGLSDMVCKNKAELRV